MHKVAAIILAAGFSRRMGPRNKLLLPIGTVPMVRHVVEQYRCAVQGPVVVVTGHEAHAVTGALAGLGVQCVFNPHYAQGQQSAVAYGLRCCPPADVILIGLADQPLLDAADISDLLRAHAAADPCKISIPSLDGRRGNPIVVPHLLRPQLTMDRNRPGCMRFTRQNPALIQWPAMSARGFYTDIDTPEAYAALGSTQEYASSEP